MDFALAAGRKSRQAVLAASQSRLKFPEIAGMLDKLVEPTTRGDPMSPLRWTLKSTRVLSGELARLGCTASHVTVGDVLPTQHGVTASKARARRARARSTPTATRSSSTSTRSRAFQRAGQPVISVDTKKKELVGDFANGGRSGTAGEPEPVRVHDFIDERLGKAIPYGVYDVRRNEGWVSVGIDHDTAEFAVASIRRWWRRMGRRTYPDATQLLITADGGGSNGYRTRLWKLELQRFADDTGLNVPRRALSARHEQVEQDRAPHVLPHHAELARHTSQVA